MTHRNLVREDFIGKTVIGFECEAANIIQFRFSDNTTLAIEAELLGSFGIPILMACDHCGDACAVDPAFANYGPGQMSTIVDDVALAGAIRKWACTPISRLHSAAEEGQDLYLRLVAEAAQIPYGTVIERYGAGDPGIQAARARVKRRLFARSMTQATSLPEPEVEALAPSAVESQDAKKLEN